MILSKLDNSAEGSDTVINITRRRMESKTHYGKEKEAKEKAE